MNEEELAKYKVFLDDVYKNISPKLLTNKSELFKNYYRFVKKCSKVVKEVSINNNPLSYGFAMSALLADGCFQIALFLGMMIRMMMIFVNQVFLF